MSNNLTIGVSTCTANLSVLVSRLEHYYQLLDKKVKFLVIWQCGKKAEETFEWGDIVSIEERGLSKSRNECIKRISGGWYWVQDDDIELDIEETKRLLGILPKCQADLALIRIRSLECPSEGYKVYPERFRHLREIPFKISSIELVVRVEFVKKKAIWFDEMLGLGTDMPCCEENLFVYQIVQKDARVLDTKLYACLHTTKQAGRQVKSAGHFLARGYFLRKVNTLLALALIVRWSVRELNGLGMFKSFRIMTRGYIRGVE